MFKFDKSKITDIRVLSIDAKKVWVGNEKGCAVFDKKNFHFSYLNDHFDGNKPRVNFILIDEDIVWLSQEYNTVYIYDRNLKTIENISFPDSFDIKWIVNDGDYLWFATSNDGLQLYDKKNKSWTDFKEIGNTPISYISSLAVDNNFLWMGAAAGVIKVNKLMLIESMHQSQH